MAPGKRCLFIHEFHLWLINLSMEFLADCVHNAWPIYLLLTKWWRVEISQEGAAKFEFNLKEAFDWETSHNWFQMLFWRTSISCINSQDLVQWFSWLEHFKSFVSPCQSFIIVPLKTKWTFLIHAEKKSYTLGLRSGRRKFIEIKMVETGQDAESFQGKNADEDGSNSCPKSQTIFWYQSIFLQRHRYSLCFAPKSLLLFGRFSLSAMIPIVEDIYQFRLQFII